jgi:hypothetical protein
MLAVRRISARLPEDRPRLIVQPSGQPFLMADVRQPSQVIRRPAVHAVV